MAKKEQLKPVEEMVSSELVAEHNRLIQLVGGVGARTVNKFATKADGVRRVRRLRAQWDVMQQHPDYKPVHPKQQVRAAQAQRTWKDPTIRAARIARHPVEVRGERYPSVRAAFQALQLPMGRHIVFRVALVNSEKGCATFVVGDEKYDFKLVE